MQLSEVHHETRKGDCHDKETSFADSYSSRNAKVTAPRDEWRKMVRFRESVKVTVLSL